MAGTLKDIVREGAAPSEAFGFGRSSGFKGGSPRVSPRPNDIGGSGSEATNRIDGPIERVPRNPGA